MQKGLFRYDVTACETKVTISSALLFDTFHLGFRIMCLYLLIQDMGTNFFDNLV